jgi:hypothetical protein
MSVLFKLCLIINGILLILMAVYGNLQGIMCAALTGFACIHTIKKYRLTK